MGKDLYDSSDEVRRLFSEVSDIGGKDFRKVLFQGTEEELRSTDVTQIAVTLVNVASALVLEERGVLPGVCAGFSLGEYTALHRAGVLRRTDLFSLVKTRGEVMERASRHLDAPNGSPGMMAVLGLDIDEVTDAIADFSDSVFVANHNGANQVVLSGSAEGLDRAEALLDEAGALRLVRLKVSGPFHSPLMEEARNAFRDAVAAVEFADPKIPIFANVTGKPLESGTAARTACLDQLVSPVRWVDSEQGIMDTQPERIIEAGPGRVLTGLWKTLKNGLKCAPAGTAAEIDAIVEKEAG